MYTQVDYHKIPALPLTMLQLYRKLFIVASIVFLESYVWFQIVVVVHLQLAMLIYILLNRPMYWSVSQSVLIFNEISLHVCICLACVFTDFTYIDVQRYDAGPVWITVVLITFFFDVCTLIFVIGYRSKLLAEHWIERCRRD